MSEYHFNERDLIHNFATDHTEIAEFEFIRNDKSGIKITPISGGMVNYIFKVQSHDESKSIIIKYGEEAMRLDPDQKLSLERQELEFDSLILHDRVLPGSVPKPFCFDRKHSLIAMEDLSHMRLFGDMLKEGEVDFDNARGLAHTLATIHRETNKEKVSPSQWQDFQQRFGKQDQIDFFNLWQIEKIFEEGSSSISVADGVLPAFRDSVKLLSAGGYIKKLGDIFLTQICFVHVDCHFEAIFMKGPHVSIFDFEFAFLSHPAWQLSWVIGSYAPNMVQASTHLNVPRKDMVDRNKRAVKLLISSYFDETPQLKSDLAKKENFLQELTICTGYSYYMYATWVTIHTMLNNTDKEKTWLIEQGTKLMLENEQVTTMDELVDKMFENIESC